MPCMKTALAALAIALLPPAALAHQDGRPHAEATYIANSGVMVSQGDVKIMFDPLFTQDFSTYQTAPDTIRAALFAGAAPYDDITAIFISHTHADHFSASDAITYLRLNANTRLVGPQQMMDRMEPLANYKEVAGRVLAVDLEAGDPAQSVTLGDLIAEAVRIPHGGGARTADIQNIVWRVTLPATEALPAQTVMHLGDADPVRALFTPHAAHWQLRRTGTAFPPYWFYMMAEGRTILADDINTANSIGVHIPAEMPKGLAESGLAIFHEPGETRVLSPLEQTGQE